MNNSFESAPRLIGFRWKAALASLVLAFVVTTPSYLIAQTKPAENEAETESAEAESAVG